MKILILKKTILTAMVAVVIFFTTFLLNLGAVDVCSAYSQTNKKLPIYSVKTDNTVNKSQIFEILDFIAKIKIENDNLKIGDIVVENILSSGANLIITGVNKL